MPRSEPMSSPAFRTALTYATETTTIALVFGALFWLLPLVAWCAR